MKHFPFTNLLAATAVLAGSLLTGDAAEKISPHVSVTGTATVEVVPDEMHWSVSVTTRGKTVASVAELHDIKVSDVVAFLRDHGVEEKKIQTSRISLSENWTYQERSRVLDGYIGSTTITFESADLDKYRDLWIGMANLADVSVNGVGFDTSERIRHQNETRVRAVRAARNKAEALANALGSSIGKPLVITEDGFGGDPHPTPFAMKNTMAFDESARGLGGNALSPGTISIETRVNATFELVNE